MMLNPNSRLYGTHSLLERLVEDGNTVGLRGGGAVAHQPAAEEPGRGVAELIRLSPEQFSDTVRLLWRRFVMSRPDLVNRAWPLIAPWLGRQEMTPETRRAAHAVAVEPCAATCSRSAITPSGTSISSVPC
ncbi:hypothetical protein ACIA5G_51330 [Amycolatopsis sp. NPDC051758]|uniref:hypothetical protein n=1 Tax=Amycolatopsis sp. NPDC051758 TaxID=3363935 RepID=UPI0037B89CE0